MLKTNEDIALQRREIYKHLHGGGGGGGCGGGGAGGLGLGAGAQQVYAHHHTPPLLMASLQKVEGSILCKILLEQTGVKLVIFLGKE